MKTPEQELEEKLSLLTDDELVEFKEGLKQQQLVEATDEPSTIEALSTGFVEGVPFLKDAIAGIDAMQQQIASEDPMNIDSFVDQYSENLDEMNQTINLSEAKSPGLNIVGGLAATLPAAPLIGSSMAAAAGYGAVEGLSRSEDRGVQDIAVGAAMGVGGKLVGDVVGKSIGKAVGKVGKHLKSKADEAIEGLVGADKAYGASKIYNHLKKTGQSREDFVKAIRKMDIIKEGDATEDILTKVSTVKDKAGKALGNFYREVDDTYKPELQVRDIKQRLKDDILPDFQSSDDPGTKEIGDSLEAYIDSLGFRETNIKTVVKDGVKETTSEIIEDGPWSISRVNNLKKDINRRIQSIYKGKGADITTAKEQERKVASSLTTIIEDTLDTLPTKEAAAPLLGQVKTLNKKFGNAITVQEILEEKLSKGKADVLGELKQILSFRTLAVASVGGSIGGPVGTGIAIGLDRIARSPKTPTYIANGLPKIAKHLTGDMSSRISKSLILASSLNSKKFRGVLESSIAQINLKQEPIPRSVEQSLQKSEDIEKILKEKMPSMHKEYKKLLEKGDNSAMGSFLDTMSKHPDAEDLFEEGVGFDGIAHRPEDKAILENQLKSSDLPAAQRIQMLNALRKNGVIPNMEEVVRPQPKVHIPKKKKQHDY